MNRSELPPKRPEVPRRGNKYAWAVVFVILMGLGVLFVTTTLPDTGAGLRGPEVGQVVPDFAAPLASGNVDCQSDENGCRANVCQRDSGCTDSAARIPACELRGESIFNVCEARERPLVLAFISEGMSCEPQVDRLERMRDEFPEVSFAAVLGGDDREGVEQIQRRRGWTLPVGVDTEERVFDLYEIGVCPSTVFAFAGGKLRTTALGNLTEQELRSHVRALLRGG